MGKVLGEQQREKLHNSILKLSAKHLLARVELGGERKEEGRERENQWGVQI